MNEHYEELIMALAEGTLDDEAAAAAAAEIAASAEASADLELQRLAIEALDAAPDVYLTATESARLHTALKQELSLATPEPRSTRRPIAWSRFLPVAGVAAALLVVIISLPTLFGGQGDDSSDEAVAAPSFEAGATETTAASFLDIERDGAEEMAGTDNAAAEAAPPTALDTAEDQAATTTTAVTLEDGEPEGILFALEFLGPIDEVDAAALLDLVPGDDVDLADTTASVKRLDPFFAECLAESVTPEVSSIFGLPAGSSPVMLGIVTTQDGAEAVLVAYVPAEAGQVVFATVLPDCSLITPLP
ncbi:MAG: hypothetical protein QNJ75_01590 [Acidimicrobiia bacterium]|nr:hypothetical protein [Acidimicrobiia bacterium]